MRGPREWAREVRQATRRSSRGARRRAVFRVIVAAAFGISSGPLSGQQSAPRDRSRPLEGRWSVELTLDATSLPDTPTRTTKGEVAFGTTAWWGNSDRFGRHSVDLRPFFGRIFSPPQNVPAFTAADTSFLSEASGGLTGDSLGVDFIPRIDHGMIKGCIENSFLIIIYSGKRYFT